MNVEATRFAIVTAAAPLWDSVVAASEFAAFGGSSYPEYRDWAKPLIADQERLPGRLHTIAVSGEPVRVLGAAGPSLLRVELLAQPNGDTGYVGVIGSVHVGPDARSAPTHVVAALGEQLAAGSTVEVLPDGDALLASGTVLRCPPELLRPVDAGLPAEELLWLATSFAGTPYLWGGTDAAGIDCSGLVHTAARMGGRVVPRDAHYQWAATGFDADWDDLEPGDLVFFGDSASLEGIDHVGIYAGGGRMLHAPTAGRTVSLEPISERGLERTVAFGRY